MRRIIVILVAVVASWLVQAVRKRKAAKKQPAQPENTPLSEKDLLKMSGSRATGSLKVDLDALERSLARKQTEEKAAETETKMKADVPAEPEKTPPVPEEALSRRVVDYYIGMWNPTDGTLFTDPAMTIDHFAFALERDHLTDTVWLEGSTQPLTSDAAYSSLPGQSDTVQLDAAQQPALYEMVKDALLNLGTVTEKNDVFYPVHPKSADDSDAKAKADLQAQMEELLRQRKQSKGSESLA